MGERRALPKIRLGFPPFNSERLPSTAAIRSPVVLARVSNKTTSIDVSDPVGAFPTIRPHRLLSPSSKRTIMTPIQFPWLQSAKWMDLFQPFPRWRTECLLNARHSTHIDLALKTERQHRPQEAQGELRAQRIRQIVAPRPKTSSLQRVVACGVVNIHDITVRVVLPLITSGILPVVKQLAAVLMSPDAPVMLPTGGP